MSNRPDFRALEARIPAHFRCDGCTHSPDAIPVLGVRMVSIRTACRLHDWLYSAGRPDDVTRAQADRILQRHISHLLREGGAGRFRAWRVSMLYYTAVRLCGRKHYAKEARG